MTLRRFAQRALAIVLLLAVLATLPAGVIRADPLPEYPGGPPSPGWQVDMREVVVEIEDGLDPTQYAQWFLLQLDVPLYEVKRRITHTYEHALTGFAVLLKPSEAAKIERRFPTGAYGVERLAIDVTFSVPEVEGVVEFNPLAASVNMTGQATMIPTNLSRTFTPLPDNPSQFASVDVGVIDTGIDMRHPLLNVVGGTDCTAGPEDRDSYGYDGYGHGTHVAGTIGARHTEQGTVGFAPGVRLHDLRALNDSGGGSMGTILCALEYAAEHDIELVNMSLGGSIPESDCDGADPMHTAICNLTDQGTIVVVAAGNNGGDAREQAPASYPQVVTVAALADFNGAPGGGALPLADSCGTGSVDDALAPWSNHGEPVDIAAPGVCILSTLPGRIGADGMYHPQYGHFSGTSMAAPAVTGAIARWLALHPGEEQQAGAVQALIEWSLLNGEVVDQPGPQLAPLPVLYVGDGAPEWRDGFRPPLPPPKTIN